MTRPLGALNNTEIHPRVLTDALGEVQAAADLITHVGYTMKPALGAAWASRAVLLYRDIMQFHYQIQQAASGHRIHIPRKSRRVAAPKAMS